MSRSKIKTSQQSRRTSTYRGIQASVSGVHLRRQQSKRSSVNVVMKHTPSSKLGRSNSGMGTSANKTKTFFEKESDEKTLKRFLQGESGCKQSEKTNNKTNEKGVGMSQIEQVNQSSTLSAQRWQSSINIRKTPILQLAKSVKEIEERQRQREEEALRIYSQQAEKIDQMHKKQNSEELLELKNKLPIQSIQLSNKSTKNLQVFDGKQKQSGLLPTISNQKQKQQPNVSPVILDKALMSHSYGGPAGFTKAMTKTASELKVAQMLIERSSNVASTVHVKQVDSSQDQNQSEVRSRTQVVGHTSAMLVSNQSIAQSPEVEGAEEPAIMPEPIDQSPEKTLEMISHEMVQNQNATVFTSALESGEAAGERQETFGQFVQNSVLTQEEMSLTGERKRQSIYQHVKEKEIYIDHESKDNKQKDDDSIKIQTVDLTEFGRRYPAGSRRQQNTTSSYDDDKDIKFNKKQTLPSQIRQIKAMKKEPYASVSEKYGKQNKKYKPNADIYSQISQRENKATQSTLKIDQQESSRGSSIEEKLAAPYMQIREMPMNQQYTQVPKVNLLNQVRSSSKSIFNRQNSVFSNPYDDANQIKNESSCSSSKKEKFDQSGGTMYGKKMSKQKRGGHGSRLIDSTGQLPAFRYWQRPNRLSVSLNQMKYSMTTAELLPNLANNSIDTSLFTQEEGLMSHQNPSNAYYSVEPNLQESGSGSIPISSHLNFSNFQRQQPLIAEKLTQSMSHANLKLQRVQHSQKFEKQFGLHNEVENQGRPLDKREKTSYIRKLINLKKREYQSNKMWVRKQEKKDQETRDRIDQMMSKRDLKQTVFMQSEVHVQYLPLIISIPSVIAKNDHIIGSLDQSYADGCRALIKKKYVKACQNFLLCEQQCKYFRRHAVRSARAKGKDNLEMKVDNNGHHQQQKLSKQAYVNRNKIEDQIHSVESMQSDFSYGASRQQSKRRSILKNKPSPKSGSQVLDDGVDSTPTATLNIESNGLSPQVQLKQARTQKNLPKQMVINANNLRTQQDVSPEYENLNINPDETRNLNRQLSDPVVGTADSHFKQDKRITEMINIPKINIDERRVSKTYADYYHNGLKKDYIKRIGQMAKFNRAVCLFKNNELLDALSIWKTFDLPDSQERNAEGPAGAKPNPQMKKPCIMPISLLFNMALSYLILAMQSMQEENLNRKKKKSQKKEPEQDEEQDLFVPLAEASLDLCQELIIRLFINQDMESGKFSECMPLHEELSLIGADLLKIRVNQLLEGLKQVLCSGNDKESKPDNTELPVADSITTITQEESERTPKYQSKNFKKLLIEDMQTWVQQAFVNFKLKAKRQKYVVEKSGKQFDKKDRVGAKQKSQDISIYNEESTHQKTSTDMQEQIQTGGDIKIQRRNWHIQKPSSIDFRKTKLFTELHKKKYQLSNAQEFKISQRMVSPQHNYGMPPTSSQRKVEAVKFRFGQQQLNSSGRGSYEDSKSTDCVTLPFRGRKNWNTRSKIRKQQLKRKLLNNSINQNVTPSPLIESTDYVATMTPQPELNDVYAEQNLPPEYTDGAQNISIDETEIEQMRVQNQQSIESIKPLKSLKSVESQIAALKSDTIRLYSSQQNFYQQQNMGKSIQDGKICSKQTKSRVKDQIQMQYYPDNNRKFYGTKLSDFKNKFAQSQQQNDELCQDSRFQSEGLGFQSQFSQRLTHDRPTNISGTGLNTTALSKDQVTGPPAEDQSIRQMREQQMKILNDNIASGYDSVDYIGTDWIESELFPHRFALKRHLKMKERRIGQSQLQKQQQNEKSIEEDIDNVDNQKYSSLDRRIESKKFKIKNALTEKNYEAMATLKSQVELIKNMQKAKQQNDLAKYFNDLSLYNQYNEKIRQVELVHQSIRKLEDFANNYQRGQYAPSNHEILKLPMESLKKQKAKVYLKFAKKVKTAQNQKDDEDPKDERRGSYSFQEQVMELPQSVKRAFKLLNMQMKWNERKQIILQGIQDFDCQTCNKQQYLNTVQASPDLNIWQRAFRKIRLMRMTALQEKYREKVKDMQERQLKTLLDSVNLVEGEHFVQRLPQSSQSFNLENLRKDFEENQQSLANLRYRVDRVIKLQKRKEEMFERAAENRIREAIDEKMGQDVFKQIDGDDSSDDIEGDSNKPYKEHLLQRFSLGKQKDEETLNKLKAQERQRKGKRELFKDNHNNAAHDGHTDLDTYQKRLRLYEAEQVYQYLKGVEDDQHSDIGFENIDQYLTRFPYFAKFSRDVRKRLVKLGELRVYEQGDIIFKQGEQSKSIYFILRGTVQVSVTKSDMGNLPVIIKILYDGQDFGEQVNLKESENLSQAFIDELNRQKCTTYANERSYIFSFDKETTFEILEGGLQSEFEQRINFLRQLSFLKDQDLHLILPLANSIQSRKFTLGQYILKEGEVPEGLYIIVKGQCKVGSERMNIRSTRKLKFEKFQQQPKPMTFKGNFKDVEIVREKVKIKSREVKDTMNFEQYKKLMESNQRMLFYERVYLDEDGKKIDDDHIAYKNLMIFFQLLEKDIFGGRVMVTKTHQKNEESAAQNEYDNQFDSDEESEKRDAGKAVQPSGEINEPSQLSVIADSAEVEIYLIDKQNIYTYPENVQKLLNERLSQIFSVERPYENEVVDAIKNKFREWDQYTISGYISQLRDQHNEREANRIKKNNFN